MSSQTYVTASIITTDDTAISSQLHAAAAEEIAALHLSDYPVSVAVHVTRQSLRNLIDACLDLQAKLAEREVQPCPA